MYPHALFSQVRSQLQNNQGSKNRNGILMLFYLTFLSSLPDTGIGAEDSESNK